VEAISESTEPRCRPHDRGEYIRRLRSYSPRRWFAKPSAMSPIECARHGFVCSATDTLQCEVCHARISLPLEPGCSSWHATSIAERTAPLLREAHAEFCGWRSSECPLYLADFPPLTSSELCSAFSERVASVVPLTCIPRTSASADALKPDALPENAIQEVFASCSSHSRPEPSAAEARSIALLAFLGWSVSLPTQQDSDTAAHVKDANNAILTCELCGMRAGLWNFALFDPQHASLPQTPQQYQQADNNQDAMDQYRSSPKDSASHAQRPPIDYERSIGPLTAARNSEANQCTNMLRGLWHSTPTIGTSRKSSTSAAYMPSLSYCTIAGGTFGSEYPQSQPTFAAFGSSAAPRPPLFGLSYAPATYEKGGKEAAPPHDAPARSSPAMSSHYLSSTKATDRNYIHEQPKQQQQGRQTSKRSRTDKQPFDAQMQHRHFCPWVASNAGGRVGYLRVLEAHKSQGTKRQRDSEEGSAAADDALQGQTPEQARQRASELLNLSPRSAKTQRLRLS